MMSDDQQPFHDAPLDAAMSEALANQGLRIEQIDNMVMTMITKLICMFSKFWIIC